MHIRLIYINIFYNRLTAKGNISANGGYIIETGDGKSGAGGEESVTIGSMQQEAVYVNIKIIK